MKPTLRLLKLDPATAPAELLAIEETLLLGLNEQPPVAEPFAFFFETTRTAVVVGTGQKVDEVVYREAVERDGAELLRRPSGGGCVLQMPGVLWFSLGVPFAWLPSGLAGGIRTTFAEVLQPICDLLQAESGVTARLQGICDIAIGPNGNETDSGAAGAGGGGAGAQAGLGWRKVAGSAQCRKQRAVLVHGTLLVSADLGKIATYLRQPEKQPEYRAGRSHGDFVVNWSAAARQAAGGAGAARETMAGLAAAITKAWVAMLGAQGAGAGLVLKPVALSAAEQAAAKALADTKYRQAEWTLRL